MTVTIYINGTKHTRDIPTSWDQVTFETFLKLDSVGNDRIKAISVFADLPYDQLKSARVINLEGLIAALGFMDSPAQAYIPETICGYPIPKDLAMEEVQMFIDLKDYVTKTKDKTPLEQLANYTTYCAVYACRQAFGKYDWQLAEKMAPQFLKAPCTEVMGVGNFTLLKLGGLMKGIKTGSPIADTPMKKFKLALIGWLLRTVSALRWRTWSKRLGVEPKKY